MSVRRFEIFEEVGSCKLKIAGGCESAGLSPGEPLIITENGQPVATLIRNGVKRWPAKAGSAKDTDHWMAPDFDAPLDEFKEYLE